MTELAIDPPAPRPGLILVATPIGNLGDLSPRALAALSGADAVLCEDTRVTGALLSRHGVSVKLMPLHEHNEDATIPGALAMLREGRTLALASDAGTPLLADPGYRLVRAAIAEGLPVTAIPGPNAGLMALTLSGLPPHPHLFMGFLPARAAARTAEIARLRALERAGLDATLILYEAPHRTAETLAALADGLGADRPGAVARELTKRFEEVVRGTLGELAARYAPEPPRGEICLVVAPAPAAPPPAAADIGTSLRQALDNGLSLRDAATAVAAALGANRRDVYAHALKLRRDADA